MSRFPAILLIAAALPVAAQHHRAVRPPQAPTPAQWLQRASITLASVTPRDDDSDLLPLLQFIGDARVVAFGDATHGTHEFFTMKQRLVPFLVARAGFRVVAFEAPYEWEKIDDFVKTGNGDPAALLQSADYFFWNTQEILDLVLAIRAWNAAGNPQVTIAGIDSVHPNDATEEVIAYLQPIDGAAAKTATDDYVCVNTKWQSFANDPSCLAGASAVYDGMVTNGDAYTHATSPDAYANALHAARVAVESAQAIATRRDSRDGSMAENVEWWAAKEKVILIGHQTHFGRADYQLSPQLPPLHSAGGYLNDTLGNAYMTFASTTLHGSFNAGVPANGTYVTTSFSFDGTNTFASTIAQGGIAQTIVLFRPPLPSWITGMQDLPMAGSVATASAPLLHIKVDVTQAYDGILYVESTSASVVRQ